MPLVLDGQKTCRIFENLVVNITKYGMPGTRAYITLMPQEHGAQVVFKNISATELDFSAEEITDRFVRGDRSRNTEGSGLGLAIAKSFAELQGCALPGFVDSKNEEKTERNAGYLVVSHSGGGMLRQGTRKGIRRTPANRGMRAHRIVKSLDISEDVCHGLCP